MKVAFVAFVALVAGVCSTRAAAAQYPRGSGGLFGGVVPQTNSTEQLDVSVSLIEGYDDDTRSTVVGGIGILPDGPQGWRYALIPPASPQISAAMKQIATR